MARAQADGKRASNNNKRKKSARVQRLEAPLPEDDGELFKLLVEELTVRELAEKLCALYPAGKKARDQAKSLVIRLPLDAGVDSDDESEEDLARRRPLLPKTRGAIAALGSGTIRLAAQQLLSLAHWGGADEAAQLLHGRRTDTLRRFSNAGAKVAATNQALERRALQHVGELQRNCVLGSELVRFFGDEHRDLCFALSLRYLAGSERRSAVQRVRQFAHKPVFVRISWVSQLRLCNQPATVQWHEALTQTVEHKTHILKRKAVKNEARIAEVPRTFRVKAALPIECDVHRPAAPLRFCVPQGRVVYDRNTRMALDFDVDDEHARGTLERRPLHEGLGDPVTYEAWRDNVEFDRFPTLRAEWRSLAESRALWCEAMAQALRDHPGGTTLADLLSPFEMYRELAEMPERGAARVQAHEARLRALWLEAMTEALQGRWHGRSLDNLLVPRDEFRRLLKMRPAGGRAQLAKLAAVSEPRQLGWRRLEHLEPSRTLSDAWLRAVLVGATPLCASLGDLDADYALPCLAENFAASWAAAAAGGSSSSSSSSMEVDSDDT